MPKVALIGSSGGGKATSGQDDPAAVVRTMRNELGRAGIALNYVQFVAARSPLDLAEESTFAELWVLDASRQLKRSVSGGLNAVNATASEVHDATIAAAIRGAELDGLVVISCDPGRTNQKALLAARDADVPVAGTGGSSLGEALALGVNIVGCSGGSVATTNESRAMTAAASLARHWGLPYDPFPALSTGSSCCGGDSVSIAGLISSLNSCLPAFLAAMLLKRGTTLLAAAPLPAGAAADMLAAADAATHVLPILVGAVAARDQSPQLGETALMAGAIAAAACDAGVGGGLFSGCVAGLVMSRAAAYAITRAFPATAVNAFAAAAGGGAAGMLGRTLRPVLLAVGAISVTAVQQFLALPIAARAAAGAALGVATCWGSQVGYYHAVMLPLILLEGEDGGYTLLGAFDMVVLCAVSAGICTATCWRPWHPKADGRLAARGCRINFIFGDFVEAAYAFMDRDLWCKAAAYLGAAAGGATLAVGGVKSSAYLPLPLAVLLGDAPLFGAAAVAVASALPFLIVVIRNGIIPDWKKRQE
ncbi:unnamed protein product [Phaeothamnion confervicola]